MKKTYIAFFLFIAFIFLIFSFIHLFPEKALQLALKAERNKSGLVKKEISIKEGLFFSYLEGGKGKPLLLLHGFGANKDNFTRIARFLSPHYRLIIPDLCGFGESAKDPDYDYSPRAQAERINLLIKALGISSFHIGGSSMGGQIAMIYASLYPKEIESMWLLNPGGLWNGPMTETIKEAIKSQSNPLLIREEKDIINLSSIVMHKPPIAPKAFLMAMARERIKNLELEKKIFDQITKETITDKIKGLSIPSLIVWGEEDNILHPDNALKLKELLPESSLVLMQKVGHLPMIEAPRRTARDYMEFRKSLK